VGRFAGREQRDIEAQRELALKNDQIQALMAIVEGLQLRADEDSAAHTVFPESGLETASLTISVMPPRQPVH
jgi:hypothetical protein